VGEEVSAGCEMELQIRKVSYGSTIYILTGNPR